MVTRNNGELYFQKWEELTTNTDGAVHLQTRCFLFFLKNTKKGENSNVCLCTQLLPQLFSLIDQQYGAQWAGSKRELKLATSGLCSCPLPTWGSNFSHHWVGGSNPLCFTTVKSLLSVFAPSVSRQRHGWRAFFKKSGVKPGVSWLGTWQFQCLCFCVPAQLKGGRTVKVSSFPLCWPVNGIKQSWREGRGLFIVTAVQRDAGSKGWSYGNQQTNGWPEYHFKKIHPPPPLICSCLRCKHQWYPFISTPDWNPEITQKRGETWPEEKQITA